MFIISNEKGIKALEYWLENKRYNTFIEKIDKNGKTFFGLIWDEELGKTPSKKRTKKGIVLMRAPELEQQAQNIIIQHMRK